MERKKIINVVAALIVRKEKVLLSCRPEGKHLQGLWEFPGGKIESKETPEDALERELMEELGISIKKEKIIPLTFSSYNYKNFHIIMLLYLCKTWSGKIEAKENQKIKWIGAKSIDKYNMPPADEPLLQYIKKNMNLFRN